MSDLQRDAEQIEALMPLLMRSLFHAGHEDPINELPLGQLRLVRALEARPFTMTELADEFGLSLSSVSQLVHRLVDIDYAEVLQDAQDRRIRRVQLTALGKHRMEARRHGRVATAQSILATLQPEVRQQLLSSLESLLEACRRSVPAVGESLAATSEIENPPSDPIRL